MGYKRLTDGNDFFKAYKEGWPFKSWKPWTIYGLGGDDEIHGGEKNDFIDGGAGRDQMYGDKGNDTYIVNNTYGDKVIEYAGEGYDTVKSSVLYTLPDHVERLELIGTTRTGYGNSLNNTLVGNPGDRYGDYNNKLYGLAGNDALYGDGGNDLLDGGSGADIMNGQGGNDIYIVDNYSDQVIEFDNQGYDTVRSYLHSYGALASNVENLELHGSAKYGYGNNLHNTLVGNNSDNGLTGHLGVDTIIGNGGRDVLVGTYVDNEYDILWGDTEDRSGGYADTFVIGHLSQIYYEGSGDALIMDFNSQDGDKIQLGSSANMNAINLVQNQNLGGGAGLDTQVLYQGNRVAILYDTTDVSIADDFLFG